MNTAFTEIAFVRQTLDHMRVDQIDTRELGELVRYLKGICFAYEAELVRRQPRAIAAKIRRK